jgi:hypothetical protein
VSATTKLDDALEALEVESKRISHAVRIMK